MKPLSRILVAVDFSEPARRAFEYALCLARRGAELIAVHAVPPDEPFSLGAGERRALLASLREQAARAGLEFSTRLQQGQAAEIVLLHARAVKPDVIVAGTHQRRGFDRLRAGSVGERLLTKASVPVLLVPGREPVAAAEPIRHVAVAVDFGHASTRAVEVAASWTTGPADRLTLLHVAPTTAPESALDLYRPGMAAFQDQMLHDDRQRLNREARRRLAAIVARVQQRTAAAVEARFVTGDPTARIAEIVDRIGADLLVVGVRKRGALSRALFGTTASRLLRMVGVPLLAVPDVDAAAAHVEAELPLAA